MIVLDTNVLSEAMKPAPASAVALWMTRQRAQDLFTTAVSEAEILLGIAILPEGRRKQELEAAAKQILGLFAGRILAFDTAAAQVYAGIAAARRKTGRPIGSFDAQIAAIARSRGMALATRNVPGFDGTGVTIIDPWGA